MTPVVLAHLGGAPEAATIVVPLLLLGAILYAGRRKERDQGDQGDPTPSGTAEDDRGDDLSR